MSISRIVATAGNEHAQKTHKDKTIVVVAKITDDTRFVYSHHLDTLELICC